MSKIDNILTTLGTNNSSQIATAVLAGFKMFFLPLATATDKTASTEQKTYTIMRDIIMEALALITYIGVTGQVQKHATAPICRAYYKENNFNTTDDRYINKLDVLNPMNTLKRGYSIVKKDDKVISDIDKINIDDIETFFQIINRLIIGVNSHGGWSGFATV